MSPPLSDAVPSSTSGTRQGPNFERSSRYTKIPRDLREPQCTIPVFRPTMEEFSDFTAYIESIQAYGRQFGLVKVIPPKEWLDRIPDYGPSVGLPERHVRLHQRTLQPTESEYQRRRHQKSKKATTPTTTTPEVSASASTESSQTKSTTSIASKDLNTLKSILIRKPIQQCFYGGNGHYTQVNMDSHMKFDVWQFGEFCGKAGHGTPMPRVREVFRGSLPVSKRGRKASLASISGSNDSENHDPNARKTSQEDAKGAATEKLNDETRIEENEKGDIGDEDMEDESSSDEEENMPESIRQEIEFYETLRRTYWKSLTFSPTYYGADMCGSLFPKSMEWWRQSKLENPLSLIKKKIPGVNTPYLYFGMWKSTFAWHLEVPYRLYYWVGWIRMTIMF